MQTDQLQSFLNNLPQSVNPRAKTPTITVGQIGSLINEILPARTKTPTPVQPIWKNEKEKLLNVFKDQKARSHSKSRLEKVSDTLAKLMGQLAHQSQTPWQGSTCQNQNSARGTSQGLKIDEDLKKGATFHTQKTKQQSDFLVFSSNKIPSGQNSLHKPKADSKLDLKPVLQEKWKEEKEKLLQLFKPDYNSTQNKCSLDRTPSNYLSNQKSKSNFELYLDKNRKSQQQFKENFLSTQSRQNLWSSDAEKVSCPQFLLSPAKQLSLITPKSNVNNQEKFQFLPQTLSDQVNIQQTKPIHERTNSYDQGCQFLIWKLQNMKKLCLLKAFYQIKQMCRIKRVKIMETQAVRLLTSVLKSSLNKTYASVLASLSTLPKRQTKAKIRQTLSNDVTISLEDFSKFQINNIRFGNDTQLSSVQYKKPSMPMIQLSGDNLNCFQEFCQTTSVTNSKHIDLQQNHQQLQLQNSVHQYTISKGEKLPRKSEVFSQKPSENNSYNKIIQESKETEDKQLTFQKSRSNGKQRDSTSFLNKKELQFTDGSVPFNNQQLTDRVNVEAILITQESVESINETIQEVNTQPAQVNTLEKDIVTFQTNNDVYDSGEATPRKSRQRVVSTKQPSIPGMIITNGKRTLSDNANLLNDPPNNSNAIPVSYAIQKARIGKKFQELAIQNQREQVQQSKENFIAQRRMHFEEYVKMHKSDLEVQKIFSQQYLFKLESLSR